MVAGTPNTDLGALLEGVVHVDRSTAGAFIGLAEHRDAPGVPVVGVPAQRVLAYQAGGHDEVDV